MSELVKHSGESLARHEGRTIAKCNHPQTSMSVAEIKAARLEPIALSDFADSFTLICERFDRDLSDPLLKQFYKTISESMGASEFQAAYEDFWKTEMFFANVVPFFIKHAQQQRDNGPDLGAMSMAETYKAGGA